MYRISSADDAGVVHLGCAALPMSKSPPPFFKGGEPSTARSRDTRAEDAPPLGKGAGRTFGCQSTSVLREVRCSPRTACSRSGSSAGRSTARCRVGGRCLTVSENGELLVLDFHHEDVERGMMRLGVDRHCAGRTRRWTAPDSIALSMAARSSEPALRTHSAHMRMPWYCDTAISCTILVSPKRLPQLREKLLVRRQRRFLAVVAGDQNAVSFRRRQREVLVAARRRWSRRAGSSCSSPRPPTAGRKTCARRPPARRPPRSASPAGSWRWSSRSRPRRAGRSRS